MSQNTTDVETVYTENTIDFRLEQIKARPSLINYYFPGTDGYLSVMNNIDYRAWAHHHRSYVDTSK